MEEHFVNYNQALALKELGFDEPCFGAYRSHSHFIGHLDIQYCTTNNLKQYEWLLHTLAPLKQQVFRWFRENHNIDGWVVPYYQLGGGKLYSYVYEEIDNAQELNVTDADDYKTYEEAESACIDNLIEIVKSKKQ
jgi:hypothetical protein